MRRPGNIFYTIIVFTRRDPPGNMDAPRRWRQTRGGETPRERGKRSDCCKNITNTSSFRIRNCNRVQFERDNNCKTGAAMLLNQRQNAFSSRSRKDKCPSRETRRYNW
ncbi:hypothetical protein PUN28_019275 [Cardiocondyla obscurior]|uniref:Uncharacterized protein n=1 Tax=Cardiocondyla obscurior TaxID=286306 RepID=A0AAW2EGK6_9HYME